jgi:hypothetical protein
MPAFRLRVPSVAGPGRGVTGVSNGSDRPSAAQSLDAILSGVTIWASARADVLGLALVGSHARGTANPASDVDIMVLAQDPDWFRMDAAWPAAIPWGSLANGGLSWRDASYGRAWSRHIQLAFGPEVELTFGPASWAATDPADPGSLRVVAGGCRILFDSAGLLAALARCVC